MQFINFNSHFQFCTTAWWYQLNRHSKLQKRAVRIMCNGKYNAHSEPLFKENKLLKIEDTFKLNCLKFYHKFLNKNAPKFFKYIFRRNSDVHSYETRNRDRPHKFPYNREGSSKRIRHYIPNLVHSWSMEIRGKLQSLDLKQFACYYELCIINSYQATCTIQRCYIYRNR